MKCPPDARRNVGSEVFEDEVSTRKQRQSNVPRPRKSYFVNFSNLFEKSFGKNGVFETELNFD